MAKAPPLTLQIPDPLPEAAMPPPAPKPATVTALIGVMAILTGLAIGAGGLFGLQVAARIDAPLAAKEAPAAEAGKGRYANLNLRVLPPVITNMAAPERTWVRLEASIVAEGEQTSDALAAQIAEDILAYLRTVTLPQIQGASGFQYLREDLNDRVRVRSGKVRELVIQSLIVE